jgi:hypothetical protein
MNFYLSKADEAGSETDRQKVMMQIVQELCKRPGLNKCGFEMPTIYIPDETIIRNTRCVNQIEGVCDQIEKSINFTIQNTLNSLEKDCNQITELIEAKIEEDNNRQNSNLKASVLGLAMVFMAILFPFLSLLNLVSGAESPLLSQVVGDTAATALRSYLYPINAFWEALPAQYHFYALLSIVVMSGVFLLLARWSSRLVPTLTKKEKKLLIEKRDYIQAHIKSQKHDLYKEYLSEIVSGGDLD